MIGCRLDEETAARVSLDKERRELQSQVQELHEDLENERNQKTRAERAKRELGQVNRLSVKIIYISCGLYLLLLSIMH